MTSGELLVHFHTVYHAYVIYIFTFTYCYIMTRTEDSYGRPDLCLTGAGPHDSSTTGIPDGASPCRASIDDVASSLGITVGVVYASRSRVLKRLRSAVRDLEQLESFEDRS